MIKSFFSAICGVLFACGSFSQNLPSFTGKTVTIRIEEGFSTGTLTASDGTGPTYTLELKGRDVDYAQITAKAIDQTINQGYKYIDSNGSGWVINSSGSSITNYIFRKE